MPNNTKQRDEIRWSPTGRGPWGRRTPIKEGHDHMEGPVFERKMKQPTKDSHIIAAKDRLLGKRDPYLSNDALCPDENFLHVRKFGSLEFRDEKGEIVTLTQIYQYVIRPINALQSGLTISIRDNKTQKTTFLNLQVNLQSLVLEEIFQLAVKKQHNITLVDYMPPAPK